MRPLTGPEIHLADGATASATTQISAAQSYTHISMNTRRRRPDGKGQGITRWRDSPRKFGTAVIASNVSTLIGHRRGLERRCHYRKCERRAWVVLRGSYSICCSPGLTRPIALVRDRRARVGRRRYRHQRQQE